ncbi:MAG: hypothetical protein ABI321_12320 [Polyangia bacterium]
MRHVLLACALVCVLPRAATAFVCTSGGPCASTTTNCMRTTRVCSCGEPLSVPWSTNPTPAMLPGTCQCLIDSVDPAPAGTACTDDGDPCTTDACNDTGTCLHSSSGGKTCNGTCIAAGTCCTNTDCGNIANGSAVCPSAGSTCSLTCNGGYKVCGSVCIAQTACCVDTDCPGNMTNHQHGVCGASACVLACDSGWKACGTTCIAEAACCSSTDCTSPPSGCYKAQGTCTQNACTYPVNDDAPCNADGNACTPNDTCKAGACVADTAHTVKCVKRDCHGPAACDTTTGNCVDTPLADSTPCGNNGCADAQGVCQSGTCSAGTKNCSAKSTDCTVGVCDPSAPAGTACTSTNTTNGTICSLADKCLVGPACSGGVCTGTRTTCTPSGACRTAECNPSSGSCEETVAQKGTTCSPNSACTQNGTCDENGTCVGDPVPDGTPCNKTGCSLGVATCGGGQCTCLDAPDFGAAPTGSSSGGGKSGCDYTGGAGSPGFFVALLMMLMILRRRRA